MNLLMISSIVATMLPLLLFLLSWVLAHRSSTDREKSSPFECGFDPNHNARVPFSMRFFLLAIIFIVFDIEIVLLIPIPMILAFNVSSIIIGSILFLMILMLGLLHEWKEGSLEWTS